MKASIYTANEFMAYQYGNSRVMVERATGCHHYEIKKAGEWVYVIYGQGIPALIKKVKAALSVAE